MNNVKNEKVAKTVFLLWIEFRGVLKRVPARFEQWYPMHSLELSGGDFLQEISNLRCPTMFDRFKNSARSFS